MDIKYKLKLYNKQHKLLNELYLFNNLQYTKTLNGIGNMNLTIPFKYLELNGISLILGQHIELYKIIGNSEKLLWYGVINSPVPSDGYINVISLGYPALLQNRKFINIELNEDNEWKKTYYNKNYGALIKEIISEINSIHETGITLGKFNETTLKTDRIINWDDDLYEKIQEFVEDSNCYFEINKDREFNFYSSIGEDKSEYYEINDYNIIGDWDYTMDQTQIFNVINARVLYKEDEVTNILTSMAIDEESINLYGRREKVLNVNDIKLQETLDNQCKEELYTYKDPLISCTVEVGISDTFNIFNINPGDFVTLYSEKYKINTKIKVLEFTVNINKNTALLTLGNAIFRENSPVIYRYNQRR
ncbi:MAG: phage tail protein [Peptostreptococcaceae bacterium]|nr:phage tail protein [Peptostreptococcaceae bacterium]